MLNDHVESDTIRPLIVATLCTQRLWLRPLGPGRGSREPGAIQGIRAYSRTLGYACSRKCLGCTKTLQSVTLSPFTDATMYRCLRKDGWNYLGTIRYTEQVFFYFLTARGVDSRGPRLRKLGVSPEVGSHTRRPSYLPRQPGTMG